MDTMNEIQKKVDEANKGNSDLMQTLMNNPTLVAKAKIGEKLGVSITDNLEKEEVQQKVDGTAKNVIDNVLATAENQTQTDTIKTATEKQKADYEKNAEIYKYFGINHPVSEKLSKRMLKRNEGWDAHQIAIASFTVVPLAKWLDKRSELNRKFTKFLWTSLPIIAILAVAGIITFAVLKAKGII